MHRRWIRPWSLVENVNTLAPARRCTKVHEGARRCTKVHAGARSPLTAACRASVLIINKANASSGSGGDGPLSGGGGSNNVANVARSAMTKRETAPSTRRNTLTTPNTGGKAKLGLAYHSRQGHAWAPGLAATPTPTPASAVFTILSAHCSATSLVLGRICITFAAHFLHLLS